MWAFRRQDRTYAAHLFVVWGASYTEQNRLTKARDAGQPYSSKEKEEKALKGEGIDAYKNHISYGVYKQRSCQPIAGRESLWVPRGYRGSFLPRWHNVPEAECGIFIGGRNPLAKAPQTRAPDRKLSHVRGAALFKPAILSVTAINPVACNEPVGCGRAFQEWIESPMLPTNGGV